MQIKTKVLASFYDATEFEISIIRPNGKIIGNAQYIINNGTELKIIIINIDRRYRKKGYALQIYQNILKENPEIDTIEGSFVSTNYQVLRSNLKKTKNCIEAMKLTPAYKIRKKLGFSVITKADCSGYPYSMTNPGTPTLRVTK